MAFLFLVSFRYVICSVAVAQEIKIMLYFAYELNAELAGAIKRIQLEIWDEKHPMTLPKGHHVSQLLFRHYHESAAHSEREQTLCELVRMFCIVSGRSLVKPEQ